MFNILLSSAGRRVALLRILQQSLRELGLEGHVIAADMQPAASAYLSADAGELVPRCTAPEFVPRLLELCSKHAIRLLVPTIDTELAILADARDAFAAVGTRVHVASPATIALANDKHATHRFLVEQGLPAPRQTSAAELLAKPEGWSFPLFAKPVGGSRSIGARRVGSLAELAALAGDSDYVVQTIAPGREYTVDAFVAARGRCVCTVPRRRLEVRDGEVSKGMTVRNAAIEAAVRAFCERLPGAAGVLCVQVFYDAASEHVEIIELNARFGGGYPLSDRAGAPMAKWLIEETAGLPSTANGDGWQSGLVMLRYDDAVYADATSLGLTVE